MMSMRNSFTQATKVFFNPETILPFMLGSVFLSIFGSSVYDILKNALGSQTSDLVKIAIGALLIFLLSAGVAYWSISRRIADRDRDSLFLKKKKPRKYRGLILLVSKIEPCEQAIRYHLPELKRCWLVCSEQSLSTAEELRQKFPQVCQDTPIVIKDVYDPREFCDHIDDIYCKYLPQDWAESDVIADFTGMTAHGSVGMALATLGTNRPLQYTPADKPNSSPMRPLRSLYPIEIILY